ncbi:piggyBac transposable element-derived protein 4-like [Polyodon spathula]|uniref:piggyBac transposable element-derived protein 4-like n=1 Tax=Polyodon spathula TaxID=7913 RepID=UPI001B7E618E|nr:piggyBac transposable element-derived protein 4-like [Polyodon spathula]
MEKRKSNGPHGDSARPPGETGSHPQRGQKPINNGAEYGLLGSPAGFPHVASLPVLASSSDIKWRNEYVCRETQVGVSSKLRKWVDTMMSEMYIFLAIVLLMGLIKKKSLKEYWSTDPVMATPFFSTLFSLDRFLLLVRALHFSDNSPGEIADTLRKIRKIITALQETFTRVFCPFEDVCIEESLMLWKGRLSFKQYIPSKRHHFGIKLFIICNVKTGYILNFIIYTGGTTDIVHVSELGVSSSVVLSLMKPYLDKGNIVYTDNWYNSPALFECLHS